MSTDVNNESDRGLKIMRLACMLEFGYIDMFSEGVTFTNLGFVREFHGRAAAAAKHSLYFIFRVNSQ